MEASDLTSDPTGRGLHRPSQIEFITEDRSPSSSRREADVAIRLAELDQHEAVVRHIADMTFGLPATAARDAPPSSRFQSDMASLTEAQRLAAPTLRAPVALRSDSSVHPTAGEAAGLRAAMLPCSTNSWR